MDGMMNVVSYGIGTILGFLLIGGLIVLIIHDVTQKKHTVLRNFPVIGRLRFFFEDLGEYFRQYFFAGDREEMPFNRATRGWVYKEAKNEGGIIGFGSTNDLREPGSIIFVNHPFPVLEEDRLPTPSLMIGEGYCKHPFEARSIVNVSGMSFGAISAPRGALAFARRRRRRAAGWIPAKAGSRRIISRAAATSSCRWAPPSTACATTTAAFRRRR